MVEVADRKQLEKLNRELLPTRQVFFDEDGEQVRVFEFEDVKQFDGRKMPAVMRVLQQLKDKLPDMEP